MLWRQSGQAAWHEVEPRSVERSLSWKRNENVLLIRGGLCRCAEWVRMWLRACLYHRGAWCAFLSEPRTGRQRMWLNYRGKARYPGLTETSIAGTPPPLPPFLLYFLSQSLPPSLSGMKVKEPRPHNHNSQIRAGGERKLCGDGMVEYGLWGHKNCTNVL